MDIGNLLCHCDAPEHFKVVLIALYLPIPFPTASVFYVMYCFFWWMTKVFNQETKRHYDLKHSHVQSLKVLKWREGGKKKKKEKKRGIVLGYIEFHHISSISL